MNVLKTTDEILLHELTGTNDWYALSSYFNFTYNDLVQFKNLINWYQFLLKNETANDVILLCKLLDNKIIDLKKCDSTTVKRLAWKFEGHIELLSKYKNKLPIGYVLKETCNNSTIGKIMPTPKIDTDVTLKYEDYLRPYKIININRNKFRLTLKPYIMVKQKDFNIYINQNYDYILDDNDDNNILLTIKKNGIYMTSMHDDLAAMFGMRICHVHPLNYLCNMTKYNFIKDK